MNQKVHYILCMLLEVYISWSAEIFQSNQCVFVC